MQLIREITLESYSIFQYGVVSQKDHQTSYMRYREKKSEKSLNIMKDCGEKLFFIFAWQEKSSSSLPISKLNFCIARKIKLINVDFQTQFIGNKRKLLREDQWKPITLEKSFSGNHSF